MHSGPITPPSGDPKAAENLAKAPVFIPAAEADAKEAQLKKEADDARKASEADRKAVATAWFGTVRIEAFGEESELLRTGAVTLRKLEGR